MTTASDSGLGSLRAAIEAANATPGADTISFNIPGLGVQTISVMTELPNITDRVTIDGTTQPTYAGTPLITLNSGSFSAGTGLRVYANSCLFRGLSIGNFRSVGIQIFGASNVVQSCFIGTDASGKVARPNGIGVLTSFGSSYTTVGGPGAGNLVSGNLDLGVCLFYSANHIVQGNLIGTDIAGTNSIPNRNDGVSVDHSDHCTVGGTAAAERNLISGNGRDGIRIIDAVGHDNVIQGNIIGLAINGSAILGNSLAGINVVDAPNNTIGGTESGARNVISGNFNSGIIIQQTNAAGNVVEGNLIGLNILGSAAAPNLSHGIQVINASGNTIGGTSSGAGNVISGNGFFGIELGGTANVVQGNLIGTDAAGTAAVPNGTSTGGGIFVRGFAHNIGGDVAEAKNIVSGNSHSGIVLDTATNCVVQANWIGLDIAGRALGNLEHGLVLNASQLATIGTSEPVGGNVVCANRGVGILLRGASTIGNVLMGNFVGVGPDGRTAYGNVGSGIVLSNAASANFIGGSGGGEKNVVSGNGRAGIQITGAQTAFNNVQGNHIGLDAAAQSPVPNAGPGVEVSASAGTTQIGGTSLGEGNRIAFNGGNGVLVRDNGTLGITLSGNSIYANSGLGINLQPAGEPSNTVTPNDALDSDSGPNHLQNFPVITNTVFTGGLTVISGFLRSVADEDFDIEIFANHSYGNLGYGDGQFYLGTTSASTDSSGFGEFQFVVSGNFGNQVFAATATASTTGETSEFSHALPTLEGLLRISEIRRMGNDVKISFTTKSGTNYRVEVTSALTTSSSWSTVSGASSVPGTGSIVTITDSSAASTSPHFYRVREL